jgi:hypothetical protein
MNQEDEKSEDPKWEEGKAYRTRETLKGWMEGRQIYNIDATSSMTAIPTVIQAAQTVGGPLTAGQSMKT